MIESQVNPYKRRVFKALLFITALGGLIFFLINFNRGLFLLASLELVAGGISLWLFFQVYRKLPLAKFRQLTMTYVLIFYALMLFALTRSNVSSNIYIWVQVIPLISYLLLGLKRGFLMTLFFLTLFVLSFLVFIDLPVELKEAASVANIVFGTLLTWGLSHAYEKATVDSQAKLKKMASTDHLTGLNNRSLLQTYFEAAQSQTQFKYKQLAVVVLDLDHFKVINDTHGHDIGDLILKNFSKVINDCVNHPNHAFRIGGEEFCLICANTSLEQASILAESIRTQVSAQKIEVDGEALTYSVSCGVSVSDDKHISFKALHAEADRRLYMAKSSGRNLVINQG
ncbi:GGDEF domain-containing protein [Marinicella rhabdoformis]|uniref:GGDEF domain-containing protein n=1 Tax=Marinicella rhabdoformis TaxID=2580566 RepID=UPI0012AEDCBB|nr:GGDEF domain-containing protein [Marinicella rhabdoformis]